MMLKIIELHDNLLSVVKHITEKVNQFEVVCYFMHAKTEILTAMIEKDHATLTQKTIFNSTFDNIIVYIISQCPNQDQKKFELKGKLF